MPEGQGAPPSARAARSAPDRGSSEPQTPARGPRGSPGPPAPHSRVAQKLAEARSSQYGLNVFVAGLLLLLAWAVHAAGVGRSHLLCALTALMLLQLLWMLWYAGPRAARRHLARLKDTHAGARWLRGECGAAGSAGPGCPAPFPALPLSPSASLSPAPVPPRAGPSPPRPRGLLLCRQLFLHPIVRASLARDNNNNNG